MINRKLCYLFAAGTVLAVTGCAQRMLVPVQMPAASVDAMHLRTVAVAQIQGDPSGEVAGAVERFLTQLRVDQRPWFQVIQPTSGLRLLQSGALRASPASDFAVYAGRVNQWEAASERYTEERRHCAAFKPGGGIFRKCLRWETYHAACLKRQALFEAGIKVVSARTGQIVHSVDINGTAGGSGCEEKVGSVAPAAELMKQALDAGIAKLNCQFAPCVVMQRLELMSDTSGLSTPAAKKRFSSAFKYAVETKGKGLNTACSEWIKLAEVQMEETVPLLFNVANCHEVNGDFDQAMEYLNRAKIIHVGINPEIETTISRVQEAQKRQEILKRQKGGAASGS